jgi:hypothetical protein
MTGTVTKTLIGTENVGYIIKEQGTTAVLAYNKKKDEWVSWSYNYQEGGKPSFFWGRYGTEEGARDAYYKKEHGIYSGS